MPRNKKRDTLTTVIKRANYNTIKHINIIKFVGNAYYEQYPANQLSIII